MNLTYQILIVLLAYGLGLFSNYLYKLLPEREYKGPIAFVAGRFAEDYNNASSLDKKKEINNTLDDRLREMLIIQGYVYDKDRDQYVETPKKGGRRYRRRKTRVWGTS